ATTTANANDTSATVALTSATILNARGRVTTFGPPVHTTSSPYSESRAIDPRPHSRVRAEGGAVDGDRAFFDGKPPRLPRERNRSVPRSGPSARGGVREAPAELDHG